MALAAGLGSLAFNSALQLGKYAYNNPEVRKFVKLKTADLINQIPLPSKEPQRTIAKSAKKLGKEQLKGGVKPETVVKEVSNVLEKQPGKSIKKRFKTLAENKLK